jgi:L-threonylcarbamoyladenylate synthase
MLLKKTDIEICIKLLKEGKIGILPTDTVYGIHCLESNPILKEKIYQIKERPESMPCITLISNAESLTLFNINPNEKEQDIIKKMWPDPNTLIFTTKFGNTLSFRIPKMTS